MKTYIFCVLILYLNLYAGCRKGGITCKQTVYSFEGNYKAYPDLDSIHINDTIWVDSNIPTRLKDLFNNEMVDYSGAENLGMAIGYVEFTSGNVLNPGVIAAANSFDNILIKGFTLESLNPEQTRAFRFKEEDGNYKFKLGIVPKKKGLFMISPGSAANVFRKNDKCTKAAFSLTFKETNQHLYLYEQSRPGYVLSEYDRGHLYAFKVY